MTGSSNTTVSTAIRVQRLIRTLREAVGEVDLRVLWSRRCQYLAVCKELNTYISRVASSSGVATTSDDILNVELIRDLSIVLGIAGVRGKIGAWEVRWSTGPRLSEEAHVSIPGKYSLT